MKTQSIRFRGGMARVAAWHGRPEIASVALQCRGAPSIEAIESLIDELRTTGYREIITNAVVNSMVNRGGITFAFRASEETGATPEQVTRAFVVCREVFNLIGYVASIEELDNVVSTETQTALQPHSRHAWNMALPATATHVRLNIYPDGGVARLRLFGTPA